MERHLKWSVWACVLLVVLGTLPLQATHWYVGAGRTYTLPSQVSGLVADGDTISIDAGNYYGDVALWRANNLVLRGVGGKAHLWADGKHYGGKAIWVIAGNQTTVSNIGFYECSVPDQNGAGIRQEGRHLKVYDCLFRKNENGILANAVNGSKIIIQRCEFDANGFGDGFSHNLYINQVDTLVFEYNYSHHASIGHELKSRAKVNIIRYNRLTNEATGTASRTVDLSNGGIAFIIGNIIEEGIASVNHNMIGYGLEGVSTVMPNYLYLIHNTLVNRYNGGSFLHLGQGTDYLKAYNNIVAGEGAWLLQPLNGMMDSAANIFVRDLAVLELEDEQNYEFQPTQASALLTGKAIDPGFGFGLSLSPVYQYVHPAAAMPLCQLPMREIGAFPYCVSTSETVPVKPTLKCYPNPVTEVLHLDGSIPFHAKVWDMQGKLWWQATNETSLFCSTWPAGVYFLSVRSENSHEVIPFVKL